MKKLLTLFIVLFALMTAIHGQQVDRDKVVVEVVTDVTG